MSDWSDCIVTKTTVKGVERVIVEPCAVEVVNRWLTEAITEYSAPDAPLPPELSPNWEPDVEDVGRAEDDRRRWNSK